MLSGGGYRTEEEIETWRQRDPITRFRSALTSAGTVPAADLDRIDAEVADPTCTKRIIKQWPERILRC